MTTHGGGMADDYELQVGARLRAIRNQLGLTLRDVEAKSDGVWKAVVVGSYERADRSVSLPRLRELANFYGVEVADLLPGGVPEASEEPQRLVVDLASLRHASADPDLWPLVRFIADVRTRRGDRGGERVTLRAADARALAILLDVSNDALPELLAARSLVVREDDDINLHLLEPLEVG